MNKLKYAYVFRRDFQNPGDLYSCIMHYLNADYQSIMIDVYNSKIPKIDVDVVFVGGGAIFSTTKFINNVDKVLSNINAKYKIAWGVGLTEELKTTIQSNFNLFGSRDFRGDENQWVPCPSAFHPLITHNLNKKPTKNFLVIDHWKRPIEFNHDHTRMINKPNNIESIIEAISNHERIFTSSYHVAYWATLLQKRTYVIGENLPGKFFTMKHSPVIAERYTDDLLQQGTVYYNAYNECINANKKFKKQVENLIGEQVTCINPNFNL